MSHARGTTLTFFIMYLSPLTSGVYLLVNLFEKPIHNAVRFFSCFIINQAFNQIRLVVNIYQLKALSDLVMMIYRYSGVHQN